MLASWPDSERRPAQLPIFEAWQHMGGTADLIRCGCHLGCFQAGKVCCRGRQPINFWISPFTCIFVPLSLEGCFLLAITQACEGEPSTEQSRFIVNSSELELQVQRLRCCLGGSSEVVACAWSQDGMHLVVACSPGMGSLNLYKVTLLQWFSSLVPAQ